MGDFKERLNQKLDDLLRVMMDLERLGEEADENLSDPDDIIASNWKSIKGTLQKSVDVLNDVYDDIEQLV